MCWYALGMYDKVLVRMTKHLQKQMLCSIAKITDKKINGIGTVTFEGSDSTLAA